MFRGEYRIAGIPNQWLEIPATRQGASSPYLTAFPTHLPAQNAPDLGETPC
jgi:hypothetical protein